MLVGRTRELDELARVIDEVAGGVSRAVHLVGDGGVGKTALAERAAARAAALGWTVAWGRAWAGPAAPPYFMWEQLIDGLRAVDAVAPKPAEVPVAVLMRALLRYVRTVAVHAPVMLILDDLHEADPDSVSLASALIRGLSGSRVMVLSTQRPPAPDLPGTTLAIAGLDEESVGRLAALIRPDTPVDATGLMRASGGNPFVVKQILRAPDPAEAMKVQWSQRLTRLDPDSTLVARTLALAGTGAPVHQQALGRLVEAGILDREGRFPHALVRDAVMEGMSADERAELHLRIAQAGGNPADVAHHHLAALPKAPLEPAMEAVLDAVRVALRRFAPAAASALCDSGLAAIRPYGTDSVLWRVQLLTARGEAEVMAGQPEPARATLTEAIETAGDREPVLAAEAALHLPRLARFLEQDIALESDLHRALDRLGARSPGLRVRLLARLAAESVPATDPSFRRALIDEALDEARALSDEALLAQVLRQRLAVIWDPSTVDERLRHAPEIIKLGVRHGDLATELDGRMWRFIALMETGEVDEAEAELARYAQRADQTGQPAFQLYATSRRGTLAALRGDFARAERLAHESHELAVRAGAPDADNLLGAQLSALSWARGGAYTERLLDRMAATGMTIPLLMISPLLQAGRVEEARAQLPGAIAMLDQSPGPVRMLAYHSLAEAAYLLDDAAAAAAVQPRLLPFSSRYVVGGGGTAAFGAATRALGLCALTLGELDEAVARLRDAVERNGRIRARPHVAACQAELADALLRRDGPGDRASSRSLLAEAGRTAAELGMPRLTERIERLSAGPAPSGMRLDREGAGWRLSYQDTAVYLSDSKGLAQLATLLANPGREVGAARLAGAEPGPDRREPLADGDALRAYRRRLTELEAALDEADRRGDADVAESAARERDRVLAELRKITGLGGRTRTFSTDSERARVNVTRTLRQAMDQILAVHPAAGLHLRRSVRTGLRCRYEPANDSFAADERPKGHD